MLKGTRCKSCSAAADRLPLPVRPSGIIHWLMLLACSLQRRHKSEAGELARAFLLPPSPPNLT